METIRHYKIIEQLGSGAMGVVYKAFDTLLERDVAIKVMHDHLWQDASNEQRLIREAQAAASILHPNVVTIYEVGQTEDNHYIVMEYLEGTPLTELIHSETAITPERALSLTMQILSGLDSAHQQDIVHRDIKPENILLTADDTIKILDFGIAKVRNKDGLTTGGTILGTVEYMAPEQMLGEGIDPRCDLYAVGVVLYQLLTHRLPFPGDTPVEILYKQLNEDPLPPSHFNSSVNQLLDKAILSALCARDVRWKSADAFSSALTEALNARKAPENFANPGDFIYADFVNAQAQETEKTSFRSVFIGRDGEFKQLVNLFGKVTREQGQTAIIMGEAGVGKSTLVNQLQRFAHYRQSWTLYGGSLYNDGMADYMPYIDALRGFFGNAADNMTPEEREAIHSMVRQKLPNALEILRQLDPQFAKTDGEASGSATSRHINLTEDFYQLISFMATLRPIILIIDDIHWADDGSLRLFHLLSRNIESNRIFLVGISRSERYDLQKPDKPSLVVEMLSRMRREDLFTELHLERLSREKCDQLIDELMVNPIFSEEFYERIFRETQGNPLLIIETLKLLRDRDDIFLQENAWYDRSDEITGEIPNRVEDLFVRKFKRLSDEEREVLQIASIIGYKIDVTLLAGLLDITKIKLLKILQHAEKELEICASTPDGIQFEHPMLRDLLYNEVPAFLRQEYHLMIAAELQKTHGEDSDGPVGVIAEHLRLGNDHAQAIPFLYKAAGQTFVMSAYRKTQVYLENLLASSKESGSGLPAEICQSDVYMKLGICYEEAGRWQESLAAYDQLLAYSEEHQEPRGQVEALRRMGRVHDQQGKLAQALLSYQQCLDIISSHPLENFLSRIYNNMGLVYFQRGEFDDACSYFEKSLEAVDCVTANIDRAHAFANLGIIASLHGNEELAIQRYQQSIDIFEERGAGKYAARVYHNLGMVYSDTGKWEASIKAYEHCLELADQLEYKHLRALTYLNMGKAYARMGEIGRGKKLVDSAFRIFRRLKDELSIAEVYHVLGLICGSRGDFAQAEKYLAESIRINEAKQYHEGLAESCRTYGDLLQGLGKDDLAGEYFRKSLLSYEHLQLDSKVDMLQQKLDQVTRPKRKKSPTAEITIE